MSQPYLGYVLMLGAGLVLTAVYFGLLYTGLRVIDWIARRWWGQKYTWF